MHITPPTKVTKENFKKYEEKKNVTTPTTACCAQGIKARDRIVYENFVIIFFLFYFILLFYPMNLERSVVSSCAK